MKESELRPNIGLKNLIEQLRPLIKKEQMKKIIDTTKLMKNDDSTNKKLNIIMCIDNSGSMMNEAIAKDIHGNTESNGSTILDLVVQSCKMFISNLEDGNIITIIRNNKRQSPHIVYPCYIYRDSSRFTLHCIVITNR